MYGQETPFEFQTPTPWNLTGHSMIVPLPKCQCYRPAIFFHHLRLISLPFPQRKNSSSFQKCYYLYFLIFLFKLCTPETTYNGARGFSRLSSHCVHCSTEGINHREAQLGVLAVLHGNNSFIGTTGSLETPCIWRSFNPLKTKRICFIQGPSAYRAVNTLHFGYKNQSLNVL
jgi:hypothetical protein